MFTGLAVLGLVWVVSQTVGARSYSLDRVAVEARVDRDGSLWIDETRTYTFDGRYSWADFRLPLDRVGSVSEFSLSEGDRAFAPGTDEAPGTYQLETSDDELYVRWHYSAEDEGRSFRLRYRISDAVTRHLCRAERQPGDARDLTVAHALCVGQGHTQTFGRSQFRERLVEVDGERGVGHHRSRLALIFLVVIGRCDSHGNLCSTSMLEPDVDCDLPQPAAEGGGCVKPA